MNVLIVFHHPAPYKVKQFNALAKLVDLTVIFERDKAIDRPDNFYSEKDYEFKCITFNDGYYGKEFSKSPKVRDYIKAHHQEFDVIVMNGYSNVAERKAIKYLNHNHIPYILMINGGVIHHNEFFLKKIYKTSYIKTAARYLSPSLVADEYLLYYGAKKENIYRYHYSSIEDKDILTKPVGASEKKSIRKRLNLPLDKKIYIAPNQFIERKNNLQLIQYFKNIKDGVLLLIGKGEEKEKYIETINELQLDNILIIDHMDRMNLFEYYKASDVVVSFSKEDIYGHTILEGMAVGIPSIASNHIVSAKSVIKNGINGYLIDIDDIKSIDTAFENIFKCDLFSCLKNAKENSIDTSISLIKDCLEK